MGRELIVYVIWCGGHQLVFEVCMSLGSLTHFCPKVRQSKIEPNFKLYNLTYFF